MGLSSFNRRRLEEENKQNEVERFAEEAKLAEAAEEAKNLENLDNDSGTSEPPKHDGRNAKRKPTERAKSD